jgi:hypothetical protein
MVRGYCASPASKLLYAQRYSRHLLGFCCFDVTVGFMWAARLQVAGRVDMVRGYCGSPESLLDAQRYSRLARVLLYKCQCWYTRATQLQVTASDMTLI